MVEEILPNLVIDFFHQKIPKKGKPCELKKEWTVLSAFVLQDHKAKKFEVIALGTGTKCLGQNEISDFGDLVHDSHAEVIAKRAFVLYLMDQAKKTFEGQKSILEQQQDQQTNRQHLLKLSEDYDIYFYSSFPPCGDATIAPMIVVSDEDDDQLNVSQNLQKKNYIFTNFCYDCHFFKFFVKKIFFVKMQ